MSNAFSSIGAATKFADDSIYVCGKPNSLCEEYNMLNTLTNFVREEEGQDLVEYALLLALVVLVVAATLPTLTGAISGVWGSVSGALSTAGGGGGE
jgi:pilus assembly protein Flp/PilA